MQPTSWLTKFADAWRGLTAACWSQSSMHVHLVVTVIVVALAIGLKVDFVSLAVLMLAIGGVIAAEVFNTAIEQLVRVIHPRRDKRVGLVLDMSAGAVLVLSIAAIAVGLMILGPALLDALR